MGKGEKSLRLKLGSVFTQGGIHRGPGLGGDGVDVAAGSRTTGVGG